MDRIKEYLSSKKITSVLDIATGRGEFIEMIRYLAGREINITGVDNNDRLMNIAREKYPDVTFLITDAYNLSFAGNSFDLVCLSNSIHHFQSPDKVMSEILRVTKPEGSILIQEMISDKEQTQAQKSHIKLHHFCAVADMHNGIYHDQTWNSRRLSEFLNKELGEILIESEYSFPIDDKFDAELMERNIKIIDHYLLQNQQDDKYNEFKLSGEELKQHLRKYGFEPAIEKLYLVGK